MNKATNVAVERIGNGSSVLVSWTDTNTGLFPYRIYRKSITLADDHYIMAGLSAVGAVMFIDPAADPSHILSYYVVPFDGSSEGVWSDAISNLAASLVAPSSLTAAWDGAGDNVVLNWNDTSMCKDGFSVYHDVDGTWTLIGQYLTYPTLEDLADHEGLLLSGEIRAIAHSSDKTRIAIVVSDTPKLYLLSLTAGVLASLDSYVLPNICNSVCFSDDDAHILVVGEGDKNIHVFSYQTDTLSLCYQYANGSECFKIVPIRGTEYFGVSFYSAPYWAIFEWDGVLITQVADYMGSGSIVDFDITKDGHHIVFASADENRMTVYRRTESFVFDKIDHVLLDEAPNAVKWNNAATMIAVSLDDTHKFEVWTFDMLRIYNRTKYDDTPAIASANRIAWCGNDNFIAVASTLDNKLDMLKFYNGDYINVGSVSCDGAIGNIDFFGGISDDACLLGYISSTENLKYISITYGDRILSV